MLYRIHAIGWDVAIGDLGSVFIEENDSREISFKQACDRLFRME